MHEYRLVGRNIGANGLTCGILGRKREDWHHQGFYFLPRDGISVGMTSGRRMPRTLHCHGWIHLILVYPTNNHVRPK
jgi:hypothetical protein